MRRMIPTGDGGYRAAATLPSSAEITEASISSMVVNAFREVLNPDEMWDLTTRRQLEFKERLRTFARSLKDGDANSSGADDHSELEEDALP